MIGDSPQGMLVACSLAEMDVYLTDRANRGINCIQVHVLADDLFGGNADMSTYDDIDPFSTPGDISTPNADYFARLDALVAKAKARGIFVMLTAVECYTAEALFESEGDAKSYAYGQYLGNRYKDTTNIIWNYGNDFQDWSTNADALSAFISVVDGIKNQDSNHLHTAWLDYFLSASRDCSDFNSRVDIDFAFTYSPCYDIMLDERALSPARPVFLGEANYEGESLRGYLTTDYIIRKQNYWTMFGGGCGLFYCNDEIWSFDAGWASHLGDYDGLNQIQYLTALLETCNWWEFALDTAHSILTNGYGSYANGETDDIDTNDYAPCAYLSGVDLAMIYMPTNRTMTVDMSQFSGTVTARWFDPTSGDYEVDVASPLANSGTHEFSHAGTNDAGDADWVLVLEV